MSLRPYQTEAVQAAQEWMRASIDPCLIEAPTGAGKSHIVAALADWLHGISGGKRVLCLAPQKELVVQNAAKMRATGADCSIFSASAGIKSTRHKIIFATPLSVKNSMSRFLRDFCAVVLDEAHTLSPTVLAIIDAMRRENPNLRVVGLTATPYRLGQGFIYRVDYRGRANGDDVARNPFFTKLVYRIDARHLIDAGYLTPPRIGAINEAYDTSGLVLRPNGKFDERSVDAAFVGHGRKTAGIVADVVAQAQNRRGVVFFAATVRHAEEVLASLPAELSAIITGDTPNRGAILKSFDDRKLKYLVNVGVLTTGWDCPHVDVIALLRRTESVGLMQQMIGRGLRLCEGKADCLVLDYAANLESHAPDGDIFSPKVKASNAGGGGEPLQAICPDCSHANEFTRHKDYADYETDAHGYCLDVFGERLMSEYGPVPGHYGRRCFGMLRVGDRGEYARCGYYWTSRECEACGEKNDIAARHCRSCKAELIDPAKKLIGEFRAHKKDPYQLQTDEVLELSIKETVSTKGNETIRADFVTPHRQFSCWFMKQPRFPKQADDLRKFLQATQNGKPATVSYLKDRDSGFFRILAFNQEPDRLPMQLG
jgi:DNA repair protein RadD